MVLFERNMEKSKTIYSEHVILNATRERLRNPDAPNYRQVTEKLIKETIDAIDAKVERTVENRRKK